MKKTNKKQIPKVRMPKYSTGGKFGKDLKDTGLFLADTALAEWAPNAISQDQYSDSPYGKNLGKVASIHESFDSQSPIRKNVSKYWTDNKSSGMDEEEQSLFNKVQPIAKTGSKIGEMWTGAALGGIGKGAGSKATGFGKNLGKFSEMGTKDYNPNVYNENQVQNQAQIESQNQTAMSGLNDARRNSMTPNGNMYAKYGGYMKFGMGGMKPNAEVENNEMITSDTPPQVFNNGGVELASNNPYGTPTYKTNGASHENGGIPMNMAPGSIINGKTKNPLTGNKFTKDVDIIAKMENKYTKKAENGDRYSNTNAKLILPILAQKKDYLNNLQNAIIANNEQRKALNRGELPQPSMDNEQMEPQGQSEQSEGEMPMARYGGRFAMGGMQQYTIGGMMDEDPPVYEPLSKDDSLKITNLINKNPRYDLKNYNFDVKRIYNKKGEEIDADIYRTDLKTGKQTLESDTWKTDNTKHSTLQEIISRQNISQGKPLNAKPQFYDTYKNSLDYLNQKHAMGGVQLPYYNTDRNGNPKYGMGGFSDEDPLTSVNTSTITNAKKVDTIPTNYTKIGTQGSKTYYDLPSDIAKSNPAGGKVSSDWENSIIKRLEGGTSAKSLADAGHISPSQIDKYNKYYKPLYTEIQPTNTFTQPSTTLPINQKIALKDENRIDRKSVFTGAPYNTFQYPDVNAGYSKATTRYFDPKTNQEIDASKSFDPKGNYVPSYLNNPAGGVEGTLKETRYNTPIGSTTDNPVLKSGTKSAGTTGFKYGGKMPKFGGGGRFINGVWVDDSETAMQDAGDTADYYDNAAEEKAKQNAYTTGMNNAINDPYRRNSFVAPTDPYSNPDAFNRRAEREARDASEMNGTKKSLMNNIDWSKTDKLGNLFNFIGQNAGNIYDLTRKNEPLQKYERAKASYLDNTAAMRDVEQEARRDEYAVRGASGGNAGTYLANRVGLNTAKVMNKDRIRQQYANANAQIGNQNAQFNTEIAYREAEARAKDAAMKENVRSQAIASLGSSFGKATKSGKQDNIDQDTLKMFQWRYKNEPGFKKYIDNFSTEKDSKEAVA